MKKISLAIILPLVLSSSLFSQSYWFGGMTRVPGCETDGLDLSVNLGGQGFGLNVTNFNQTLTNKNTSVQQSYGVKPDEDSDEIWGVKTFQIGADIAWVQKYFEVEGGMDLGLNGLTSDIIDADEAFVGINFRLGAILKYTFEPSDEFSITPYLRSGLSFEFVTNDFAVPTTTTYYTSSGQTITVYDPYSYDDLYGTSFFNTFYNFRLGTTLQWKGLIAGISLGKYFPIGGDLSDYFDSVPGLDAPSPLFMQLNLAYQFSNASTIGLGLRLEWYSQDWLYTAEDANYLLNERYELEWEGAAVDLTYKRTF